MKGEEFFDTDLPGVPDEVPASNFTARQNNATLAVDPRLMGISAPNSTPHATLHNNSGIDIQAYPTPYDSFVNDTSPPGSDDLPLSKLLYNNQDHIEAHSLTLVPTHSQAEKSSNLAMPSTPHGGSIARSVEENDTGVQPKIESPYASSQSFWAPTPRDEYKVEGPGEHPYLRESEFAHAADCLDPAENDLDTATAFGGYEEAVKWREDSGQPQGDIDNSIPTKDVQKQALVKVLFKAFKSIAKATDNEAMIRPFKLMKHDNARVEVVCWEILDACIRHCESGSLVALYDPTKGKVHASSLTFAERFDYIVKALSTQKTICKHLFDAPFVNTFVDDPIRAKTRVESNRILNERKGKTMRLGKEVTKNTSESPKKRLRHTTEESESPEVRDSPYLTPAPTRRPVPNRGKTYSNSTASSYPASSIALYSASPAYTNTYGAAGSTGSSPNEVRSSVLTSSPPEMPRNSSTSQSYNQLRSGYHNTVQGSRMNGGMAFAYDNSLMPNLNRVCYKSCSLEPLYGH